MSRLVPSVRSLVRRGRGVYPDNKALRHKWVRAVHKLVHTTATGWCLLDGRAKWRAATPPAESSSIRKEPQI